MRTVARVVGLWALVLVALPVLAILYFGVGYAGAYAWFAITFGACELAAELVLVFVAARATIRAVAAWWRARA